MLVSLSDSGVDVIGPLQDEFDGMEIVPANTEEGPLAADSAYRRIKKPR